MPSSAERAARPVPVAEVPLERREGWGMSTEAVCRVVYAKSADDIRDAYALARQNGWKVAFWGNGRSYGDAALNEGQLLLDFSRMDRILEWDRVTGRVVVEPGVTLEKLWKHCLPDSYWPPVVSGTMFTSIGGLASANAHGKNNWKHGPIGEHIDWFEILTPDGQLRRVDRDHDPELFHAAIGGFGWLGAFVRIALTMKKVYSGRVDVLPFTAPDLEGMFKGFERCNEESWDYVVGWVDAFARGNSLGRGQIHAARYLDAGEDPEGATMLSLAEQELPERFFGVIPKGWLWFFAKPWANQIGGRIVNMVRFFMMNRDSGHHRFLQAHAQFNFLLDYVPNWKWMYKPGGLIQYQLFIPKERAKDVARRTFELCQQARLVPLLVVMKRHRADKFWLSHAVDGYSFAMDFKVDDHRREDLWRLTQILNEMVVEAGGRFYFAKDSVVSPDAVRRSLGAEVLGRFFAKKLEVDPDELVQSNLYRRVMAPLRQKWTPQVVPRPEPVPDLPPETP